MNDNISRLLSDENNEVYITNESIKEFVHLAQNERIGYSEYVDAHAPLDVYDLIENALSIKVIYTSKQHVKQLMRLPLVKDHNDPIDRIIISIAISENIAVLSSGKRFEDYAPYGLRLVPCKRKKTIVRAH
ncbi:MAG: PIN domain-containing protein [Salinivirgaceae bacterium]|nr:PIN domain-containing protein [Salinivirgaceae bacterium]